MNTYNKLFITCLTQSTYIILYLSLHRHTGTRVSAFNRIFYFAAYNDVPGVIYYFQDF